MLSPLLEFNFFTMLLMLAVALMVWFLVARERGTDRRMTCMMEALGLEYDMAATSDPATEAIINRARARCLRCRSEGLCERWLGLGKKDERFIALLAGATEGASGRASGGASGERTATRAEDFCPNAATFTALAARGGLQSESGDGVTPSRAPSP